MGRHRRRRSRRLAALAAVLAVLGLAVVPVMVAAHPLGNFTINHYAGLRVEPDRVVLDVVIDQAEVPTFQARLALDVDDDAEITDKEVDAGRVTECRALLPDLALAIDGRPAPLRLTAAGLTFPKGAGGLATMRLVCVVEAAIDPALSAEPIAIDFEDRSFAERLGWREIVVSASGTTLAPVDPSATLRADGASGRLTAYPEDLVARPLADTSVALVATVGGAEVAPLVVADATAVPPADGGGPSPAPEPVASPAPVAAASTAPDPASDAGEAVVPGGVADEVPSIFRTADLTPLVLILSILTAVALGAGHALTPGHGKTLMAAYLVGTRGTPVQAIGLALSVSLSHTVGILVLAAIVVGAADVLPPDVVVRAAPVVAAVSILGIGAWMLLGEWRRRRAARADAHQHVGDDHHHDHDHKPAHAHEALGDAALEHRHGGVVHAHAPSTGSTITWRSLFVLGLAGGLIPSTSALIILLGAIATGRAGFGFLLVLAFGLGMAAVMGGIGLVIVLARERLERVDVGVRLEPVRAAVPLVAAVLVFGFGIYLTAGAVSGAIG